jgi:hypothetical protein
MHGEHSVSRHWTYCDAGNAKLEDSTRAKNIDKEKEEEE